MALPPPPKDDDIPFAWQQWLYEIFKQTPPVQPDHRRAGNIQMWVGDAAPDPGVSDGFFDETDITQATETTVGPTGSGATFIWSVMDLIPAAATILLVDVELTMNPSIGDSAEVRLYDGDQTFVGRITGTEVKAENANDTITVNASNVMVPLSLISQNFKFYWTEGTSVATTFDILYRGFITD